MFELAKCNMSGMGESFFYSIIEDPYYSIQATNSTSTSPKPSRLAQRL
jgi:hypothetical protein